MVKRVESLWEQNNNKKFYILQTDHFRSRTASNSSYLDMRPGPTREEPYMKMDDFLGASQAFSCDMNMRRNSPREDLWKSSSQGNGSTSLGRFFKKGNRHKADYVFLDLEKNNYVDMNRISDKKWKSLTIFQPNKWIFNAILFCSKIQS